MTTNHADRTTIWARCGYPIQPKPPVTSATRKSTPSPPAGRNELRWAADMGLRPRSDGGETKRSKYPTRCSELADHVMRAVLPVVFGVRHPGAQIASTGVEAQP